MEHIKLVYGLKQEGSPFMRLTDDLILQILIRLPVKSLGTCKLLSKTFNFLISDPQFAISHLEFSNKTTEPLTLFSLESAIALQDYKDIANDLRLIRIPTKDLDYCSCFSIGSSHGLVCIYQRGVTVDADLMFIWNPIMGERREIVLPQPTQHDTENFRLMDSVCWFGYLPSINQYKIFLSYFKDEPYFGFRLYLYSFSSSTWREILVTYEVSRDFGFEAVFLNEALHGQPQEGWISKFDLVEETFEKIPCSISRPGFFKKLSAIFLGVTGKHDCLCVVSRYNPLMNMDGDEVDEDEPVTLDLWVLQDYENLDSWKKWCTVDLKEVIFRKWMDFVGFTYDGFLYFQGDFGRIIVDPMNDPPSYVFAPISSSCQKIRNVSNYVESLISPSNLP